MATKRGIGEPISRDNQETGLQGRNLGFFLGAWTAPPAEAVELAAEELVVVPLHLPDQPFECRSILVAGTGDITVCLYRCSKIDALGWTAIKSAEVSASLGVTLNTQILDLPFAVVLDRRSGPWLVGVRAPSGATLMGGLEAWSSCFIVGNQKGTPREIGSHTDAPITLAPSAKAPAILALSLTGERFYRAATLGSFAPTPVTSVSGVAPISSSGGATPAISLDDGGVSNAKLRDSGALSVIGRAANSVGDPADISAVAASGSVLRESGSTIGFGQLATAGLGDDAVDNTKLANMTQSTVKGRASGAGTGDPTDLTASQVATILSAVVALWPDGSAGAPGGSFANETDLGVRRIGANNWALVAGNSVDQIELSLSATDGLRIRPPANVGTTGNTVEARTTGDVQTTNATATNIWNLNVPTGESWLLEANVIGRDSAGNTNVYKVVANVKNVGGVVTVTSTAVVTSEDVAGWNATFNNTGVTCRLQVTGAAATTINWRASVLMIRVT